MSITKDSFGALPNGTAVTRYTLTGKGDLAVSVLDYGAIIQSIRFAGKDVALGFENAADYTVENHGYIGATIGRYANRIAKGKFPLNGKNYALATNNGQNHLHGGDCGFNQKVFEITVLSDGDRPAICASTFSPDGEEGYPGNLKLQVTFTVTEENALEIVYDAVCDADTIANFTNHAYFNLNGFDGGDVLDTLVTVHADAYTPTDSDLIPIGIEPVADTPFDFRTEKPLGDAIGADHPQIRQCDGIDHNFVLQNQHGALREAIVARSPKSGIRVVCSTDLPGVQIYTANGLDLPIGKGGPMTQYQGFCMETQFFPDTPNHADFPSCVLRAGEAFHSVTSYAFSKI